jgi:hydrogenase/urease accessory protein HupE
MKRVLRVLLLWLAALACLAPSAFAHEIRPAFLQIRELEPQVYDILWKTPAQGDMRLALNVVLPEACSDIGEPRASMVNGAVIQRWRARCEGGLVGKTLAIENLGQTLTDTIVRFEPTDAPPKTLRLTPDKPETLIPGRQAWTEVAATYFGLGVEHILFGFDHLLFVLALILLVADRKKLIGAVTAFTVAHSLTLAGTTFGWIRLPSSPVEAMIALSIMAVAIEIVRARSGGTSLMAQLPWVAAFGFGLLHGFGFAGALREIGIPEDAVPLALLSFNLGVEAGQLLFIAAMLAIMLAWRRFAPPPPAWAWRAPVYVIGGVSAFWFIERAASIFAA